MLINGEIWKHLDYIQIKNTAIHGVFYLLIRFYLFPGFCLAGEMAALATGLLVNWVLIGVPFALINPGLLTLTFLTVLFCAKELLKAKAPIANNIKNAVFFINENFKVYYL